MKWNRVLAWVGLIISASVLAWNLVAVHGWWHFVGFLPGFAIGLNLFTLYDGYVRKPRRERLDRSYAQLQQHAQAARTRMANITATTSSGSVVHTHRPGGGHEPLDPDRIPDSTTPIKGWRHWRLGGGTELLVLPALERQSLRLASVSHDHVWTPGENVADCAFYPHEGASTTAACACGFYAFSEDASSSDLQAFIGLITGTVEGWGRVQVHQSGWRAEKAQITGIYDTESMLMSRYGEHARNLPLRIAEAYGVPLLPSPYPTPTEWYFKNEGRWRSRT